MGIIEDARAFRAKISDMARFAPDELILNEPMAFGRWNPGTAYLTGDVRRDANHSLYRCLQAHTSQEGWEPSGVPALWQAIGDPAEEWPLIPDPIPAANPWGKDQKGRTAGGGRWISRIDGNVWQPKDYPAGWTEAAV